MQFSKAEKTLNETNNYNPPPGYYTADNANLNKTSNYNNYKFSKEERFVGK